jgi:hypothetical protein
METTNIRTEFRRDTDEAGALETDWQEFNAPATLPSNTGLLPIPMISVLAQFTHNVPSGERADVTWISTGGPQFWTIWLRLDSFLLWET